MSTIIRHLYRGGYTGFTQGSFLRHSSIPLKTAVHLSSSSQRFLKDEELKNRVNTGNSPVLQAGNDQQPLKRMREATWEVFKRFIPPLEETAQAAKETAQFMIADHSQTLPGSIIALCLRASGNWGQNVLSNSMKSYFQERSRWYPQFNILENFHSLGIQNPDVRFEIAKICAERGPGKTAAHFWNFDIKEESARIEIAKICARGDAKETARHIGKFRIQDEAARIEIAKLCIQGYPSYTADHIGNFEIRDQGALIELAKLCAQQASALSASSTSDLIRIAKIQDEAARIEIAKLCAQSDPGGTALHMKDFKIQDEAARIEIAKLCARGDGGTTAGYIGSFEIQDQAVLIEITKLCAQGNGRQTAKYIGNFKIQDQAVLIEIAKLCAQENGGGTAEHIGEFKIQDETALIEIAKLCAQRNVGGTPKYIGNFKIQDETALIEIAKLCAQRSGGGTAEHIGNFKIQDEAVLIEIAKLCAQSDGGRTARYIGNFKIQNEAARIEIAKLCAQGDGGETAVYIKNFKIQNEAACIEIAKLCAQGDGVGTARHIGKFGIQDEAAFLAIVGRCVFRSIGAFSSIDHSLTTQQSLNGMRFLLRSLSQNSFPAYYQKSLEDFVKTHLDGDPYFLKQIDRIAKIQSPYVQQTVGTWLASFLLFADGLDRSSRELIVKTQLVQALCEHRSPSLRTNLTPSFMELCTNERLLHSYQEQSCQGLALERYLMDLLLIMLQDSGVAKGATQAVRVVLRSSFKGDVKIRPLLETLYRLHASTALSPDEKQAVLEQLCQGCQRGSREGSPDYLNRIHQMKPELRKRVFSLLTILLFQAEKDLVRNPSAPTGATILPGLVPIQESAKKLLQEKLHLDGNDESASNFSRYFGGERDGNALMVYAAKLSSLNEPKVMEDLGRYVNGVLNGTFEEDRYKLENNLHLQQITEGDPSVLQAWRKALEPKVIALGSEKMENFDARAWLRMKLLTDRHIDLREIPHVRDLLAGREVHSKDLSPLEKALQALLLAGSQQEQIVSLKNLKEELLKLEPCEFVNDVAGQLKVLDNSSWRSSQKATVVDSDHYLDLLLIGTEVIGSCQNVNGFAGFNKGLLGYLLNGANRPILIKDEKGRIMARAKLSLLWDGTKRVLFLDRFYSRGSYEDQCRKEIVDMALQKASQLGVPLATLPSLIGPSYPGKWKKAKADLLSFDSGVSYEYADAARGVQINSVYKIPKEQLLFIDVPECGTPIP